MRTLLTVIAALAALAGCASGFRVDPNSDAPEVRVPPGRAVIDAGMYREALESWRTPEDINAWIGAKFEYDLDRAILLSESQRMGKPSPVIHAPEAFFASPRGVCVDLARFAVESLRVVAPDVQVKYVMIEFNPVAIAGNTLRRHWVVSFERGGMLYYFADSKRPGHIAGPYGNTQEFIADYSMYRGRDIVSFKELQSNQRRLKTPARRGQREDP
jgi:hypothetical protein